MTVAQTIVLGVASWALGVKAIVLLVRGACDIGHRPVARLEDEVVLPLAGRVIGSVPAKIRARGAG